MIHVHSCYDILRSTIKIENLVKKSKECGFKYAAVCDGNLSSWPYLVKYCAEVGIKPVLGYESHEKGWFFFALNKNGYYEIIRYRNGLLNTDYMLSSDDLLKITDDYEFIESEGHRKNIYFGIDEHTEPKIVDEAAGKYSLIYFREICFLEEREIIAIDLMEEMRKSTGMSPELLVYGGGISGGNVIFSAPSVQTAFANMLSAIDSVQEFSIKSDFSLLKTHGDGDSDGKLKDMVFNAFEKSSYYEKVEYVERISLELEVIVKKGFSDYLLLAKKIVDTAREKGIAVGPGRGSAVASLVSNVLGITVPDPVKNNLIFERFISIDREDFPDIDIDVEDRMRQNLISVLRDIYGSFRVVHVGTYGTFGEKLVSREIARKKMIALKEVEDGDFSELKGIMLGLPHHRSIHAAGIILSEKDISEMIPLYESSPGVFVTEYDMDSLNDCGIVKIDILGLSTISVLKDIYGEGCGFETNMDDEYGESEKVFNAFDSGNCSGIFQLDSRSGRYLLSRTKPSKFEDIAVLISLNRPGPGQSGLTDEYIDRKENGKKITYAHPLIKEILKETYGVPIFQEQVMEIAMKLADFSPKQANDLRKAIAKKDPDRLAAMNQEFIAGMSEHSIDGQTAARMFREILDFAGYAFNKAHATAYAMITYALMYAKVHIPLVFYRTLISHNSGKSGKAFELICEARKNGVAVEKADINESLEFASVNNGRVILGISSIKEIGPGISEKIVKSRDGKPFLSVEDLLGRVDHSVLSDRTLAALYESGALDSMADGPGSLEDILSMRDKMKNDLKNIMDLVFEGKKEKSEEISSASIAKRNAVKNTLDTLRDEVRSYGFLVDYKGVFGVPYPPFGIDSDFRLAVITSIVLFGSKYLAFDGSETYEISEKHITLNLESKIITVKNGKNTYLVGVFSEPGNFRLSARFLRGVRKGQFDFELVGKMGVRIVSVQDKHSMLEIEI